MGLISPIGLKGLKTFSTVLKIVEAFVSAVKDSLNNNSSCISSFLLRQRTYPSSSASLSRSVDSSISKANFVDFNSATRAPVSLSAMSSILLETELLLRGIFVCQQDLQT